MITEAVVKITTEVNAITGDHAQALGEYLIDTMTEASAEKIMQEGKKLSAAISQITSKAQAMKSGNSAMVRYDVVYGWLNEYYGITPSQTKPVPAPQAFMEDSLQVNLMDLL